MKVFCLFLCFCWFVQLVSCQFGFFTQQDDHLSSPLLLVQGILSKPKEIRDRLSSLLHNQPDTKSGDKQSDTRSGDINDETYDKSGLLPPEAITATRTTTTTPPAAVPEPSGKNIADDFIPAFPDPPICGVSNASFNRVVGGVDANLGDFPWMALLGYKGEKSTLTLWKCGGSLISSKHVLTAAHCIHNYEKLLHAVRLGELDLAREDDGATPVDVLIKHMIKHEEYNHEKKINDIGMLVLEREVQFTNLIKPICIPKDTELRSKSFEDHNPIIAGWGDTEFRGPSAQHLQALQLPVVTNEVCAQAYKTLTIDGRVLCAGFKKGGKDACQGDSGGPLMQPIWNTKDSTTYFYQIGVVSYGKRCAEAGFPGVYSRVTHFVPWLQQQVLGHA